jgi:hypothetical protein
MSPHRTRLATAALATVTAALLAAPAAADTSTVTATVSSSVSISTAPSGSVGFGTLAPGLNTVSGGTLAVTANTAYTVTVAADKATMTVWDGTAYGTDALGTALALVPTISGGAPVVTSIAAIGTLAQTLMTGVGGTTDSASLSLEQTLLSTDKPGSYRTVLTYTAAPTL